MSDYIDTRDLYTKREELREELTTNADPHYLRRYK